MNRYHATAGLVASLILTACGGGGGSSGMPATQPFSPGISSAPTPNGTYNIGGTVSGLTNSGIVLSLNGGAGLAVAADGAFTFPNSLASGTSYVVTVQTQPSVARELCGVTNGSGTLMAASVNNVTINCSAVIGFLYQLDWANNQIESYGISAITGLPIPFGSPVATGPQPSGIAAGPGGSYLYVTNLVLSGVPNAPPNPGTISTYAVNRNSGELTPVGAPLATGFEPQNLTISSAGFLFVSTWNGETGPVPQPIMEYVLDPANGAPSPLGTFLTNGPDVSTSLAVTPDGQFLYTLAGAPSLNDPLPYTLTPYAIDPSTGTLTQGQSLTVGNISNVMTIDPLGRFLYLTNSTGTPSQASGVVMPYAIDSGTGAVTAIGAGTAVVSNMGGLAAGPTGTYLYLVDSLNFTAATDTVQALSIASTGAVSTIGSIMQTDGIPSVMCDPSGQFVYVPTQATIGGTFFITTFVISTDPATAGQLIPSGQPLQTPGGGAIVIVE